jgi:hypothetical protein
MMSYMMSLWDQEKTSIFIDAQDITGQVSIYLYACPDIDDECALNIEDVSSKGDKYILSDEGYIIF